MRQVLIAASLGCAFVLGACQEGATPRAGAGSGAAAPSPAASPSAAAPGAELVGLSTTALEACAGPPPDVSIDVTLGPTEHWIYATGEGETYCRAQFTISRAQVTAVRLYGPGLTPLTNPATCAPIIGAC